MLRRSLPAVLSAFLILVFTGFAQEFRGSLSGRIIDQQQAVIPGAKIVATETETGAKSQTQSNADGTYVLPFLPPGPYSVSAEAAGFKRYVNNNVRVTTNEREQIDIQLEVGTVDQSVTVSAESSMLDTATATRSCGLPQIYGRPEIESAPLAGPERPSGACVPFHRESEGFQRLYPCLLAR